jgi:hypothetical protein
LAGQLLAGQLLAGDLLVMVLDLVDSFVDMLLVTLDVFVVDTEVVVLLLVQVALVGVTGLKANLDELNNLI